MLLIAGIAAEEEFVKRGKDKIAAGSVRMNLAILLPCEDKFPAVSVKEKASLSWMNKMDPLISISYVHKKIYELPNMYQKILASVNFYNVVEYVKSLNKLFNDSIMSHFNFEETEIFSVVFVKEEMGLQGIISELRKEHRQIIEKLGRINEVNSQLAGKPDAQQKEKDELGALCTQITQELTDHAQKEDTAFYPFLKDMMFGSN